MIALMQLLASSSNATTSACAIALGKTPQAIICETEAMLEFLVRMYYMRHSFDLFDPWIAVAMTMLGNKGNALLQASPNSDRTTLDNYRSIILLSAKAFESQAQNFHVATSLGIQLQSIVKPDLLQLIRTYVKAADVDEEDQELITQHPHSQWPIPIISLTDNPETSRLRELIKLSKKLSIKANNVHI